MQTPIATAPRKARVVPSHGVFAPRRRPHLFTSLALALTGFLAACGPVEGTGKKFSFGTETSVSYTEYEPGDVVAQLELVAPATTPFVLRATLPLQPGQYVGTGPTSPFVIVDSANNQSPAQVEIVSRFANAADGADVVELLARVERPAGVAAGTRIRYDVQLVQHPVGSDLVPLPTVANLLSTPGAFRLRTKDVFGHVYSANLGAAFGTSHEFELKNGPTVRQVRTYETLTPDAPVGGNGGTLPHMMGAHAYFTTWAGEEFVSLDLRINNGASGHDHARDIDDPLGDLYFEELELVIPQGWQVLTAYGNPYLGTQYAEGLDSVLPIVRPIDAGDMHYMPSQSQFHRRMVLCAPGAEARAREYLDERNLAFCRPGENVNGEPFLSWWNPASARYYSQHLPLPLVDRIGEATLRSELSAAFTSMKTAVQNGDAGPWPIEMPTHGWAHPMSGHYGGSHGGQEIHLTEGVRTAYAASNEGYRQLQLRHRMVTDRHPTALYDWNGEPTCVEDWVVNGLNGPYLPAWVWLRPVLFLGDPFGYNSTPDGQRQAVVAQGRKPAYQDSLAAFQMMDTEHLVRYTRNPKALVWLGNDAIARDDLTLQGELSRMSYSPLKQSDNGMMIVTGMASDRAFVESKPGDGFNINRGEGWMIDAIVSTYAVTTPARRATMRPWFDDLLDTVEMGQSACTGAIGALPNGLYFGGQYRTRQSISEAIVDTALWSVRSTVYENSDPGRSERLRQVLVRSAYALISDVFWDYSVNQPWFYVAMGPFDQQQPSFCGFVPADGHENHDDYQVWGSLAYGYLLTGDSLFMTRARQLAGGNIQTLQERTVGYLENGSPTIALDQLLTN
ncbi:MAG: hypothetical protein H6831_12825 [Planctomycetes bacterium]|nr:hypothetical protein [Planctomycetota bacterium]